MPEAGTPLLVVDRLIKRFGGLEAVSQVGFQVAAGEIVGLIGPNGAGKSTVFNLITGALRSDGGTVSFLGQDITRSNQRRIAKAGIARTFQHVKLRSSMSLIDNVLLGEYLRTRTGFLGGALRLDRAEEARARVEACGSSNASARRQALWPRRQSAARPAAYPRSRSRTGRRSRDDHP